MSNNCNDNKKVPNICTCSTVFEDPDISTKMAYSKFIQATSNCVRAIDKSKDECTCCRCKLTCNSSITQSQYKLQTLKHSSYYIGISKKMAYGKYMRVTPGMETFASKKIPVMQPLVNRNFKCFSQYWCQHL